ncbi:MAG: hypothetical protein M1820_001282 [Bogoriella megaspora]|nr:MAG: hypothetical protein M1820_001282 [Bogoriella megaspora]
MFSPFIFSAFVLGACAAVIPETLAKRANPTIIPSTVFNDYSTFESYFNYLYPWGSDHNGAARMVGNSSNHDHIAIKTSGTLTLTAQPVSGQPPTSSGLAIKYLSGTVYAKNPLTVTKGGGYDISGSFQATTTKGTWPAFWLTATKGWPPEIDIAEWKGSGKISFNTFNTSSQVTATDVNYPNPSQFHDVKAELRDENGSDVSITFYLDGKKVVQQVGKGYVGAGFWLIMDLQMEGSSGSPGPTTGE